jgi:hypothetical protein
MALNLTSTSDTIEVISSKDESVTCGVAEYGEYLLDLDEEKLGLKPDIAPTRFVLKKILPYGISKKIKDQQVGYKDGEVEVRLGFMLEDVRASLVSIINPGTLEFKKEGDGFAAKSLIEKLDAYGIVQELYTARQGAVSKDSSKKS